MHLMHQSIDIFVSRWKIKKMFMSISTKETCCSERYSQDTGSANGICWQRALSWISIVVDRQFQKYRLL